MNRMVNSQELLLDEIGEIQATKPELGTILVVEDDPRMQKVLKRIFTEESYSIDVAGDGKTGLELFRSHRPVAVVLDLILPQISGRELCQTMKSLAPETPVIVLSAITEVVDKVLLLELGADDYVTKPFSPRELMARVQAAIRRRRRPTQSAVYRFGECEIDFEKMTAKRAAVVVALLRTSSSCCDSLRKIRSAC